MRITELVKTYRLLNDPDAPNWNVKFVGALVLVAAVALGVGGLYWATAVDAPQQGPAAAESTRPGPDGTSIAYVGQPPGSPVSDPALADAALASWKAAHPGAAILSEEPVLGPDGRARGYDVRYRP